MSKQYRSSNVKLLRYIVLIVVILLCALIGIHLMGNSIFVLKYSPSFDLKFFPITERAPDSGALMGDPNASLSVETRLLRAEVIN